MVLLVTLMPLYFCSKGLLIILDYVLITWLLVWKGYLNPLPALEGHSTSTLGLRSHLCDPRWTPS
jgi:hypothetical protein